MIEVFIQSHIVTPPSFQIFPPFMVCAYFHHLLSLPLTTDQKKSPELHGREAPPIGNVFQLQLLILLALGVEIDAVDVPRDLVEADVVEAFEAGARDLAHAVVGHEEGFLPAHEDVLALGKVLVVEVGLLGLLGERPPRGEARPVLHVRLVGGAPRGVPRLEGVFGADDLAFEVSG